MSYDPHSERSDVDRAGPASDLSFVRPWPFVGPAPASLVGEMSRRWMLVPLPLSLSAGFATFFEQSTASPIFQSILQIAPAWMWGCAWLSVAFCALFTLRFGTAFTYQCTNIGMVFMSLMWGGSTAVAKFFQGIPLTSTPIGLWATIALAFMVASFMPFHVATPSGHNTKKQKK